MENFFGLEAFSGDVAGLFDFQGGFGGGGPGGSGAEENDAMALRNQRRKIADLLLGFQRLAQQRWNFLQRGVRVRAIFQHAALVENAQNERGDGGESGGIALGVSEGHFLLAGLDAQIGAENSFAGIEARNRDCESTHGFGGAQGFYRLRRRARVRDDYGHVFGAKRQRIVRELEGLLGAGQSAAAGMMAHPTFGDIGGVQGSSDADEDDALASRGCLHGAFDGRARFRENLLDQLRLIHDRVVEEVGMSGARFRHLLFLRGQCIRGSRES